MPWTVEIRSRSVFEERSEDSLVGLKKAESSEALSRSIALDCLNGYFHFPFFDSLPKSSSKPRNKGAVAVFAPSA